MERIKNEYTKEIMGAKGKLDIMDIIQKKRLQWYGHVKRMPEKRIPKLIVEWIPKEKKRMSKKNMDGWSTSSHDSEKFRTRSVEKQGGMAFGFRKMVTAVIKPDRLDRK
jgi:Tfp pilus assembly pilus retraction ATPase PilT